MLKDSAKNLAGRFDHYVINLFGKIGVPFLRTSIGIVFIWFGALKTVGNLSPAYDMVAATVYWLTPGIIVPILGWWEIAIGVCFLIPALLRIGLLLLALQMPGTFLPLILLPEQCFKVFPFVLTLEGQYIVKNLVIIGAALVIGAGLTIRKPMEKSVRTMAVNERSQVSANEEYR